MSFDQDPTRLKTDPTTSPALRSMLNDAQATTSNSFDVDRLTLRVEAAILADLPGPNLHVPAKSGLGGLTGGKAIIVGAGLAIGVVAGSVWNLKKVHHIAPPPSAMTAQSSVTPAAVPLGSVSPPEAATASPNEVTTAPTPADSDTSEAASRGSQTGATSRDSHFSGLNEVALLDSARAALATDPRRALSLTQEHARRFPHGALAQEREVIAIEALTKLGQTAAAKARGSDFERRYPGSAHQPKIDQTTRGR